MIRNATIEDTNDCLKLAKEFYGDFMKKNGIDMIDADLLKTVEYFIATKQNLLSVQDGKVCGMIAWMITPHPANFGVKILQEVLWCCKSSHKTDALALLRGIEKEASKVKADVVMLANLSLDNEPAIRRIYNKMGYSYTESHYSKGK